MNLEVINAQLWSLSQKLFNNITNKEDSFCFGVVGGFILSFLWKPLFFLVIAYFAWVQYNKR